MYLEPVQYVLGAISGGIVGFTLGLFGGGGSILAVPMMMYVVGVPNTHVAIGTSAVSVATTAFANLFRHARLGHIKWRCASIYSAIGAVGAFTGSSIGKMVNGQHLLTLFAGLMMIVSAMMFLNRNGAGDVNAQCTRENVPSVLCFGGLTGLLSGFFGVGGGFLIVPSLMASTGMPILYAVGSSLVAVTVLGFSTAANYALSGYVDWPLTVVFILVGIVGGLLGAQLARALCAGKETLRTAFSVLIAAVALYVLYRSALV